MGNSPLKRGSLAGSIVYLSIFSRSKLTPGTVSTRPSTEALIWNSLNRQAMTQPVVALESPTWSLTMMGVLMEAPAKRTAWAAASIQERICSGTDAVRGALASLGLHAELPTSSAEHLRLFCSKGTALIEATTRRNDDEPGLHWLHDPQEAGGQGGLQPNASKDLIQLSGDALHAMSGSANTYMNGHGAGEGGWENTHTDFVVDTIDTVAGVVVDILGIFAEATGVAGPILSIVAGVVTWIIRLFLMIYAEPEPTIGELINSALAKERMRQNTDFWSGIADELETFPSLFVGATEYSEAKTAWLLILQHDLAANRGTVFMRECLSNQTWDSDICTQYIKDGMWEVMLPYAQVHFAVLTELQMQFLDNSVHDISHRKTQVELLVARTQEVGREYVAALEHAWEVYEPYRKEALWNPWQEDFYEDWNYVEKASKFYHPFDFIHARVDKGYNDLNVELPLAERKGTHANDKDKIRSWGYEGCEGERHDDVTKKNNPVKVNDACNLFHTITDPGGSEQCQCTAGNSDSGKWYQTKLSDDEKECWARCMNHYQQEQFDTLEKTFKNKVEALKEMVDKLDYEPTLKVALQGVGTTCKRESRLETSKCAAALELAGLSKVSTEEATDEQRPAGCSLKGDGTLLINSVEAGKAAAEYAPLCAALFRGPQAAHSKATARCSSTAW